MDDEPIQTPNKIKWYHRPRFGVLRSVRVERRQAFELVSVSPSSVGEVLRIAELQEYSMQMHRGASVVGLGSLAILHFLDQARRRSSLSVRSCHR